MPSMKRSPGTTNAAHWVSIRRVFYFLDHAAPFPVMDMGLCNWSEIRISYLASPLFSSDIF